MGPLPAWPGEAACRGGGQAEPCLLLSPPPLWSKRHLTPGPEAPGSPTAVFSVLSLLSGLGNSVFLWAPAPFGATSQPACPPTPGIAAQQHGVIHLRGVATPWVFNKKKIIARS